MAGGASLSPESRSAIEAGDSAVYLSAASAWEMAIKRAKGRLDAPTDVIGALELHAFRELPVRIVHSELAAMLPSHHSDPFDRILIAQAKHEGLTIVTRDPAFGAYGVPLLAA